MGDVIPMRKNHLELGELALDALTKGRTQLALCHLAQVYLDTAPDRERARPIAEAIKAFGNLNGSGDGAA
jgi:hypothetical protein